VSITGNSTAIHLFARKSGTYSNYNVQLGSGETLNLINSTLPYNVSVSHSLGNQTLECVGLDSHQNWTTSLCSVISATNTTAIISTQSFTSFLVIPVLIPLPAPDTPITTAPIPTSDTEDSVNPAPAVISFVLILGGIVAFSAFRSANRKKYAVMCESQVKSSPRYAESQTGQGSEIEPGSPSSPRNVESEQADFKGGVEPNSSPSTESRETYTISLLHQSVKESHMLVGIPQRPEMVAELLLTLLTDILVLGVCYVCWLEGDHTADSANDIFAHYSGEDMKFVCVAVVCGTTVSSLSLLRKPVIALCSFVLSLLELTAVICLNIKAKYEEGGRWGVGVLIALGLQMALETVKCCIFVKCTKAGRRGGSIRRSPLDSN